MNNLTPQDVIVLGSTLDAFSNEVKEELQVGRLDCEGLKTEIDFRDFT